MKKTIVMAIVLLASFLVFALNVSTSILPYYYVSKEIVQEKGQVNLVVPPGKSPHTYSPTPKELIPLYESDVLITNGLSLEIFISNLTQNLEKQGVKIIQVSDFIPPEELISMSGTNEDHDHEEFAYNPHFWLDPYFMYTYIIPGLVEVFGELDPVNKDYYVQNADRYINRLISLDNYLAEKAKVIDGSIFTLHNSYDYFARRYDIKIAGVIQLSPGVEPTPKQLVELSNIAKEKNVKAIFNEPQLSDKAVNAVAENLNLTIGVLDPLGSVERVFDLDSLYVYNLFEIIRVVNYGY
ncbi:MAG: metal ABC transporter substrate-binding protein [Thermotogota bacterium]|nr:metal ABC transporter substrate-binding protein [Thermotogota bacterium]